MIGCILRPNEPANRIRHIQLLIYPIKRLIKTTLNLLIKRTLVVFENCFCRGMIRFLSQGFKNLY
jgi:hypothetical protein